jgi:hypothetical protein
MLFRFGNVGNGTRLAACPAVSAVPRRLFPEWGSQIRILTSAMTGRGGLMMPTGA